MTDHATYRCSSNCYGIGCNAPSCAVCTMTPKRRTAGGMVQKKKVPIDRGARRRCRWGLNNLSLGAKTFANFSQMLQPIELPTGIALKTARFAPFASEKAVSGAGSGRFSATRECAMGAPCRSRRTSRPLPSSPVTPTFHRPARSARMDERCGIGFSAST